MRRASTDGGVVAERFVGGCAGGLIDDLLAVLDPGVIGVAALEGHMGPSSGSRERHDVAQRVLELFGPGTAWPLVPVPFEVSPGMVALREGRSVAMFRFERRATGEPLLRRVRPPAGSRLARP